jgi:hypothetical protein
MRRRAASTFSSMAAFCWSASSFRRLYSLRSSAILRMAQSAQRSSVMRKGGALALLHGAEVDLLQLVEGDGRQRLGRGLGGLCLLFCGDGRGGFIAHAVAPFWCSAARVAASWL